MFSLFLSLLLFIYPSPAPLHFPPFLPLLSVVSEDNCAASTRQSFREGRTVQGSAEAYNLLFTPNLSYPELSLSRLSCILSLFHSSFCLHRGMNFNHSTLHLQSQLPPPRSSFFPSFLSLATQSRFPSCISSTTAPSLLATPPLIISLQPEHRRSPLMTRKRKKHVICDSRFNCGPTVFHRDRCDLRVKEKQGENDKERGEVWWHRKRSIAFCL